tara:strand:+ start:1829 stop:2860 length:1032 start_codon:yes stop_codon:yes gene_type:complete
MYFISEFEREPTLDKIKYIVNELYKANICLHNFTYGGLSLIHINQPPETMRYLLNKNINPNFSGIYDLKPIHFQSNYETIKLLIERGAQPNPKDINDFNPLFWNKDPDAMKLLLETNEVYPSRIISRNRLKTYCPYYKMLVNGGYDPHSEDNISISPVFLQRNVNTLKVILDHCFQNYLLEFNHDLVFETVLFKPYINDKVITLFTKYDYGDIYSIDHQNIIGNTALHCQYNPDNILSLLQNGANAKIKNNDGKNAFQLHLLRNNLEIADIIEKFTAAKTIQNSWRSFYFRKCYIKPKYFKQKKLFLEDFILLPPSLCKTFPGGILFQETKENFMLQVQDLNY